MKSVCSTNARSGVAKLCLAVAVVISITFLGVPVLSQPAGGDLAQKFAAIKESVAQNQQRLHQYQWVETMQLSVKGSPKPPKQFLCQYGPDGKVQKSPIAPESGTQQSPPRGLKGRMVQKKTEEMQDYMGQVKQLLSMYIPPDPQKMQQEYQDGKVYLNKSAQPGIVNMVFKDYAQPGDQMTLTFNTKTKKLSSLSVNTYLDKPDDTVTLNTQFGTLPGGTNYTQRTMLNMKAKQVVVNTTNADYRKL